MAVRIKICGITRIKDALLAADSGADAVGFIFYKKSPRYISPEAAGEIIQKLPPFITSVGVFVSEQEEIVKNTVSLCQLDAVQLHGDEPADFLAGAPFKKIRAIRVKDSNSLDIISDYQAGSTFVLDAFHPDVHGGTGLSFDWSLTRDYLDDYNIIIAGGLKADNVANVIEEFNPYGVDVSSGVEIEPGVKDPDKLCNFIKIARQAELRGDK